MRMVVCSDLHLDFVTMGVPRIDEVALSFRKAVDAAIKWKADLFLCCGDVCDPDSGAIVLRCAREIVGAADVLRRAKIRSAWVCGNHDVAGDGKTTSLDPLLELEEAIVFRDAPGVFHLENGWTLVGLPYPSSPAGWGEGAKIEDLTRWSDERDGVIVAGHLSIEGVQPGEESDEMARGKDCFWPTEEVEKLKPRFKMAGHYHKRQTTKDGIQIVGSLARLTFGAEDHEPGFLKVEL